MAKPTGRLLPLALLCLLPFAAAAAATPKPLPPPPTPDQRALIAAKLYWAVSTYFAHAEALPPDYDFDRAFERFLPAALSAPDRLSFDEAAMRLVASLRNGHTWFHDDALSAQPHLPFALRRLDGHWIVTRSRLRPGPDGLGPGDEVVSLDGRPFADWAAEKLPLLNGSSDAERERRLPATAFLWPDRFRLGLLGGRAVTVDRFATPTAPSRGLPEPPAQVTITTPRPDLAVIAIPGFDDPRFEEDALRAVQAHRDARAILFDVRGNGGGSTPSRLLKALIDTPYRDMLDATPLHIGTHDAWARLDPDNAGPPDAMLRTGGEWIRPDHPIYPGRVFVLADHACASACEDFVLALHLSRRATLLGETTWGSTGQPFIVDFPPLGMRLAVSTRREYLPGFLPFEGIGVSPDIPLPVTQADLRATRDTVLDRALRAIADAR